MIFCDENDKNKDLTQLLSILFKDSSIALHVNCSFLPKKHLTLIKSFGNGYIHVVACSGGMSRGIDIEDLNCVINNGRFLFMKQDQCSFFQATLSFRKGSYDKIVAEMKIITRRPTLINFIF